MSYCARVQVLLAPPASLAVSNVVGPGAGCSDQYWSGIASKKFPRLHGFIQGDAGRRSGARVFLAHATLRRCFRTTRPLPFFVKLGPRRKILKEHSNYRDRVHNYIPFHLAPRLVTERCEVGTEVGILVGDFVEDSETLSDVAQGAGHRPQLEHSSTVHCAAGIGRSMRSASALRKWLLRMWGRGSITMQRLSNAAFLG